MVGTATRLVDVRSPEEYRGEMLAPDHLPQEQSQVPGHIPGAANIPWSKAPADHGSFRSLDELRGLYEGQGITPDRNVTPTAGSKNGPHTPGSRWPSCSATRTCTTTTAPGLSTAHSSALPSSWAESRGGASFDITPGTVAGAERRSLGHQSRADTPYGSLRLLHRTGARAGWLPASRGRLSPGCPCTRAGSLAEPSAEARAESEARQSAGIGQPTDNVLAWVALLAPPANRGYVHVLA